MSITDATHEPLPALATRQTNSHKGTYGRVLLIAGSRGKAGAAALAGKAALRSGAGLVTVAVPQAIQHTVASFEPSLMTIGLGDSTCEAMTHPLATEVKEIATGMNCLALGPGLGTAPSTFRLVQDIYHQIKQPMVVDADGLNALADWPDALERPGGPRVLTPHPGEFQRLSGERCVDGDEARAEQAAALSLRDKSRQTVVVLKGHHSIVTDGELFACNQTGNPGLATGGTGDVLTGIITALVAQGLNLWQAARLGVHVHGLAGDIAAEELGEVSLIASDLLDYLPRAFRELQQ